MPPEVERAGMPRTILRWAEQWDNSILKNAVDFVSGQVGFNLPLVQVPPRFNLGLHLSIYYSSESAVGPARELGIGWTLSHFKEHIYVDLRGSIFPEDRVYNLLTESGPVKLEQDPSSPLLEALKGSRSHPLMISALSMKPALSAGLFPMIVKSWCTAHQSIQTPVVVAH